MNAPLVEAYIGLGSNLGNPGAQLRQALHELDTLPDTTVTARSSLYSSRPLGPADQPDFVNAVARIHTSLPPLQLLDALQTIEDAHGRVRAQHWGPRTLDLDLLLYGDRRIDHERLTVPHPHMHQRDFVLRPLVEIAPLLQLPGRGAVAALLHSCEDFHTRMLDVDD